MGVLPKLLHVHRRHLARTTSSDGHGVEERSSPVWVGCENTNLRKRRVLHGNTMKFVNKTPTRPRWPLGRFHGRSKFAFTRAGRRGFIISLCIPGDDFRSQRPYFVFRLWKYRLVVVRESVAHVYYRARGPMPKWARRGSYITAAHLRKVGADQAVIDHVLGKGW